MNKSKVAVIGGGISGLACVHRLLELKKERKLDFEIILFEAGEYFGGTIATETRGEFVLEKGPDSFLSEKPWALNLIKKLGIESEVISTRSEFRKSFVARGNQLIPLPEGFYLTVPLDLKAFFASPLFSLSGKMRMCFEPFIPKRGEGGDESVGSFITRRFGKEALERVGQAMIAGIYTGDPHVLSLQATMPRFLEFEQKYGSLTMGLRTERSKKSKFSTAQGPRYSLFLSLESGLGSFTKALTRSFPSDILKSKTAVKRLMYRGADQTWNLETQNGAYQADAVCLCVSAQVSGQLLSGCLPQVSEKLCSIPYESVATLNLGFKREQVKHALDGFGFVVPAIEKRSLIACSFSSVKFEHRAPKDCVLIRAFIGGAFGAQYYAMNDQDLIRDTLKDLSDFLGLIGQPLFSELTRYPKSMVQYQVGHLKLISDVEEMLNREKGIFLAGSAYRGVGIPDCIRDGEKAAEQIVDKIVSSHSPNTGVSYAKA